MHRNHVDVTHDQAEAMAISDRIAVMREGWVEQVGSPETIYARPASLRPEALGLVAVGEGQLAGAVEEAEYRGDQTEYRVRVGAAVLVVVESAGGRGRRAGEGDRVGLRVIEETLHVLPAQPEASGETP